MPYTHIFYQMRMGLVRKMHPIETDQMAYFENAKEMKKKLIKGLEEMTVESFLGRCTTNKISDEEYEKYEIADPN